MACLATNGEISVRLDDSLRLLGLGFVEHALQFRFAEFKAGLISEEEYARTFDLYMRFKRAMEGALEGEEQPCP